LEDLSLHILDIAENSTGACAKRIEILITRDAGKDLLRVEINDDGRGMDRETLSKVRDPFFTTKGKKTGLGLPFLSQAAEQAGGEMSIASVPGKGTRVTATFQWSNVDRPPLGDMAGTLLTLIAGHPDLDFLYEEREGGRIFRFDTREIKNDLEGVPINTPPALEAIRGMLNENRGFGT
jgi:hypothetical protein